MSKMKNDGRFGSQGLKLSVNAQRVSQGHISRQIFVAHRMGKFPGIKETRGASKEVLAGAAGGQCKAHGFGSPVEQAI